jgi:glutaminyl-tRNA synthetase
VNIATNFYFQPIYMAPTKGTSPETAAYIDLFKSIGLSQAKASEASKSAKGAALLQDLIERHALTGGRIDEKQAGLVAALAVQGAKIGEDERGYVVHAIIDGRLKSTDQVNGASHHPRSSRFPIRFAHIETYSRDQVP